MTAIFPGSFDPPTIGHVDVIYRAAKMFEKVVVAVMINSEKKTMFSAEERCSALREACAELENVEVIYSDRLTIDLAHDYEPAVLVKGLRTAADFDYEAMIAAANIEADGLDSVFIISRPEHTRISSTVVREFGSRGGEVDAWAPESVVKLIKEKFELRKER